MCDSAPSDAGCLQHRRLIGLFASRCGHVSADALCCGTACRCDRPQVPPSTAPPTASNRLQHVGARCGAPLSPHRHAATPRFRMGPLLLSHLFALPLAICCGGLRQDRMFLVLRAAPQPPLSYHGPVRTRRPGVSALLGPFSNHRFCGPHPTEKVVCSGVRAAGGVRVGVKVPVWL